MPGLAAQDVFSPLHDLAEDRWTVAESLWHGVLDNIVPLTSTALEEPCGDGLRECGVDKVDAVAVPVPEVEEASREKHTSEDETDTTPVSSGVPIGEFSQTWTQDMKDAFDSLPGRMPLFSST
jgi:hypothetical protein